MRDRLPHVRFLLVGALAVLAGLWAADAALAYAPRTYMSSLHFDGTDWLDEGEKVFPVQGSGIVGVDPIVRLMNKSRDFNGDGYIDPEDNLEMVVPFKIGTGITGTTRKGYVINSTNPNDQKPAVYFRRIVMTGSWAGWEAYEYWVYLADNDWVNNHEHDWEQYFVYLHNGSPERVRISRHGAFYAYYWTDWTSRGLVEDSTHLKMSLDGGSHAFKIPSDGLEDGVRITYAGYINKRGGRLDYGNGMTFKPYVFSNDPNASDISSYTLSPYYYFYGDPWYGSGEWDDPQTAAWNREYWSSPPAPY